MAPGCQLCEPAADQGLNIGFRSQPRGGVPYWNRGYCTEAARAVVAFGFSAWGMHRIQARHYTNNPASGRVMEKIGMTYEGCLRQCVQKWGEYLDVCIYGILEEEEIL